MSATLVTPKTTSGGEIITHLINATDGEGLHFDGAAGSIDIASPPDLGTKFSFEFIIQADDWPDTNAFLVDFSGSGSRFILGRDSGTSYNLGVYDLAGWKSFGVKVLDDLKVHHLTLTVDGTSAILYDNANQVATVTISASHNIDGATDATIASRYAGATNFFDGTIYRCRFWNKTLSQAEVTASYENATVPFADQYGSQTSLVDAAASVFTSGTYSWTKFGNNTIANVGNALVVTYVDNVNGAYNYFRNSSDLTTDLTVGKRYRFSVDAKYAGGAAGVYFRVVSGSDRPVTPALTTSFVTYHLEFTAQSAAGTYIDFLAMAASNVVTIDNWYVREIGAVSDYDLAFANPTQSLMVQDRAGAADGTSSATGVVQVTPIEQLNSKSARIGTSAATPADGELLVSGNVGVGSLDPDYRLHCSGSLSVAGTDEDVCRIEGSDTTNSGGITINATYGNTAADRPTQICSIDGQGQASPLELGSGTTTALTIDSAGNVGIGRAPTTDLDLYKSGQDVELKIEAATNTANAYYTMRNDDAKQLHMRVGGSAVGGTTWAGLTGSNQASIEAQSCSSFTIGTHVAAPIVFVQARAEKVRIASDGLATFSNGIVETNGVLKENLLTNSGFDVWSNSTLCEVTSGAAPVTVGANAALVNNLLTNGAFDSATTSWTPATWSGAGTGTFTSVAGGATGNAGKLDSTGGRLFAYQNVTVEVGKLYYFSIWGKDGSGESEFALGSSANGSTEYTGGVISLASGGGAYKTFTFEATSTTAYVSLISASTDDSYFDTVCLYEVTPGCVNTSTNYDAPDGWWKDALTKCWRQHNDGGTLTHDGSFYALKMTLPGGGYEVGQPDPNGLAQDPTWTQRFAGRTLTFGCWMKSSNATLIRIVDSDGNTGATHTGGGGWEWVEVTRTCGASITSLTVKLRGAAAETVYVSQPMLVFGSAIGSGNYSRPMGEIVNCEAAINIQNGIALVAADDKILNLEALSSGKIPKGAKAVNLNVITKNTTVADYNGVAYKPTAGWDNESGLQCLPLVNSLYQTASGTVNCDSNGDIYQNVTEAHSTISENYLKAMQVQLR